MLAMDLQTTHSFRQGALSLTFFASMLAPSGYAFKAFIFSIPNFMNL